MPLAAPEINFASIQHLRLSDVPWDFYESTLAVIGDGPTRTTYCRGELEIMSPLPEHETWGWSINQLLIVMALERNIPLQGMGSTTFRDTAEQVGLEPDECYYVRNIEAVKNLKRAWNPVIDPPPDLAIEIDITRRSIEREPIYAALDVQELWRFDGKTLTIRKLDPSGEYRNGDQSEVFPFLPMEKFTEFVLKLGLGPQLAVLIEFRDWVRSL